MLSAGDLIHRVSVETRTETSDGHDGYTDAWTVARRRMSSLVRPLAGRDLERARQIDPRATHEVTFRFWRDYPDELKAGRGRLTWHDGSRDRVLEIVEVPRETEQRVRLDMICKEAA